MESNLRDYLRLIIKGLEKKCHFELNSMKSHPGKGLQRTLYGQETALKS
jgi:hypothetical protein